MIQAGSEGLTQAGGKETPHAECKGVIQAGGEGPDAASGRQRLPVTLIIGLILVGLLLLAAVLAPVISPCDPLAQDLFNVLKGPGSEGHLLGTDQLGRDMLSRILYAARTDLTVMVLAEIVPFFVGILLGMLSAYFGGKVEWFISLLTDTFIAFPYYLLVIVVAFATGAGIQGIFITFMLVGWLVYARVSKGVTASLRKAEWVESAKGMGYSDLRIILTQIFPNVLPQAVVVLMTDMAGLLVIIVTLGYLGIGITPPTPDWGTMISEGQNFMTTAWWLSVLPGLMVVYTGVSLSFLGDGLADLWNPKPSVRRRGIRRKTAGRMAYAGNGVVPGSKSRLRKNTADPIPEPVRTESGSGICPESAWTESGSGVCLEKARTESGSGVCPEPARTKSGSGVYPEPGRTESGSGVCPEPARTESGSGVSQESVLTGAGSSACSVRDLQVTNADGTLLVDHVSVQVMPGDTLGLVGESGSGKTLTMRSIIGLLPEGISAESAEYRVTENTAMIFQNPKTALDPLFPVFAQLCEVIRLRQSVSSDEARRIGLELLRRLSLPEDLAVRDRLPGELSGGQCQRILIAIALACRPSLLLCDEPTTALDVTVQKQTLDLIRDLQAELGFAMIFVTHNLAVASDVCERLAVMQNGRIIEEGTRASVLSDPQEAYTKELIAAVLE